MDGSNINGSESDQSQTNGMGNHQNSHPKFNSAHRLFDSFLSSFTVDMEDWSSGSSGSSQGSISFDPNKFYSSDKYYPPVTLNLSYQQQDRNNASLDVQVNGLGFKSGMNGKKRNGIFDFDISVEDDNTESHNPTQSINTDDGKIEGIYDHDLDLIQLNLKVMKSLEHEKNKSMPLLTKKLALMKAKASRPQTIAERNETLSKIEKIEKKIKAKNQMIEKYSLEVKDIIDHYRKLGSNEVFIKFGDMENEKSENSDDDERYSLIEEFLAIASKYIDVNVIQKTKENYCPSCLTQCDDMIVNDEVIICPHCFVEVPIYIKYVSENSESKKSDPSARDLENFIKKIDEFEGIKPNNYPANMEQILDEYFLPYQLHGVYIRSLPLNSDRRTRGKTTKTIMMNGIKALRKKLPGMYKYAEWICVWYWGWVPHNLDDHRDILIKEFLETQKIINHHKGSRKSNLNRDYRLYRHLEKINYSLLDIRDFRMVKDQSLKYHENMWFLHVIPGMKWNQDLHYQPRKVETLMLDIY